MRAVHREGADHPLFLGLLALLVWAPLPFASNRAWGGARLALLDGVETAIGTLSDAGGADAARSARRVPRSARSERRRHPVVMGRWLLRNRPNPKFRPLHDRRTAESRGPPTVHPLHRNR